MANGAAAPEPISGVERLQGINEAMKSYTSESWGYYFLFGTLVAAVVGVFLFKQVLPWYRDRRETRRLFESLCAAHALNPADRHYLLDVFPKAGLAFPALLFFARSAWDKVLAEGGRREETGRKIFGQLFGEGA